MAELTIEEWKDWLAGEGVPGFRSALKREMVKAASEMVGLAKQNATTGPRARTGRLRASIRAPLVDVGGMPAIALSAGGSTGSQEVTYAGSQEFGARIRPRDPTGYLRVPLRPAKTAAGVDRFGGDLRVTGAGEGFYAFKSASSGKLFLGKRGDEIAPGIPRAWYALVKEVTVPRTLFLGRAMEEVSGRLHPLLEEVFNVQLSIKETSRGS